jgi:uncharacterized membrane protein
MLSLVMLGPIYSIILNMGLDWVLKIIYPFIFAFVPLGIYTILREQQINKKIAFLACFFFISIFTYYTEMLQVARQEIAELFLVLLILSMLDRNLNDFQKSVFFLIFSTSIIVSHYGLTYLFLFILILAWSISAIGHLQSYQKNIDEIIIWFRVKFGFFNEINLKNLFSSNPFPFFLILYYCFFTFFWYFTTSGGAPFKTFTDLGTSIITSIASEFMNPDSNQGLAFLTQKALTPFHEVVKYLIMITIFFIVIGFMFSVLQKMRVLCNIKYLLLSFGALCICLCGGILPYFAMALNTSRLYQISLIFLAPFCVLGELAIFRIMSGLFKISWTDQKSLQILSVFFAIFLLFNSGWPDEILKENPGAFLNNTIDYPKFNELEVTGVTWLTEVKNDELIYADDYRWLLLLRFYQSQEISRLPKDPNEIAKQSFVYFGNFNIKTKSFVLKSKYEEVMIIPFSLFTNRSRIYCNGNAEVYFG